LSPEPSGKGVRRRLMLIFVPILVSAAFILALWFSLSDAIFPIFGLLLLSYFISPFGKEVLVPTAIISLLVLHGQRHMVGDIALVTTTVVFVDVMCSIFLLWNLDVLKLIPKIGKWITGVEDFGRKRLRKSKTRRKNTFIALTGYMALPFQGSGGIVSTIIGMMAGMKKKDVWMAVWVGSITGTLSIAIVSFYAGQVLIDIFGSVLWYAFGLIILIGIGTYIMIRFLRFQKRGSVPRLDAGR